MESHSWHILFTSYSLQFEINLLLLLLLHSLCLAMGTTYSNVQMNNFLPKYRLYLHQMCRLQPQSFVPWPSYNCPLTHSCIIYIPTHNLQPCVRYTGHDVCTDRFVICGYQTVSSTSFSHCHVVLLWYTKQFP
jgi:hypothetical protein